MASTMLEASFADLLVVERLLRYPVTDDDSTLGIIGYHLQQCIEKSLKALLEGIGMDYRAMGHSIGKYLRAVSNQLPNLVSDTTNKKLQPYVNILTDWESAGRYPSDFLFMLTELKQIEEVARVLYNEVADYFGSIRFEVQVDKTSVEGVSEMNLESN